MAFRQCFFFDTPEVTKLVLPKVLQNYKKTASCTCWPKKVNQKGFPFFPQNTIPEETKKPLSVFWHCETSFPKKSPKDPFNFFDDLRQKGWNLTASLARQFGSTFGFYGYCRREYIDTLGHLLFLSLRYGADFFEVNSWTKVNNAECFRNITKKCFEN